MVAARKLDLQTQLIEVIQLHKMAGSYPDVPIASTVDYDGLVQPDIEAGDTPFFITIPLGERDAISRNGRRYVGDVAINAIHDAIQKHRITGKLGHTAEERRGWEFKLPVLHWVGSLIQDGIVWGKAYVPRTAMELREYYRIQGKKNANVGTSLEGWGVQEFNDDLGMYDILELEVNRVDAVEDFGVGILKAGSMPPKITSETRKGIQEAAPDEVAVGDFVTWNNRNNMLMRGQINTIWTEGAVEVPYSDSPALEATAETPIARMDIFIPNYDGPGWVRDSWQEIQYVRDLTKIESLPELNTAQDSLSEGQEIDEQAQDLIENLAEDETPMATKATETQENHDENNPIVELKQQHQKETRELKLQISELEASLRNYNTMLEMLTFEGKKPDDPILALQALAKQVESLEAENFDLLDVAITQEVAEHVKVEILQPVIVGKVRELKPARKTEVKKAVADVLARPEIKTLLKYTVQQEMGPNVETPKTPTPDVPVTEQWIIIPEIEGVK
jgi:hypothetical protein